MVEHFLLALASIVILGVGAQWIAWRLKLPSILLLLIAGFFAGAVTGFLNPEKLFGNSLLPAISLAVAIILFEGGLQLKWKELKEVKDTVRNLITIGALITWMLISAAAYFVLNFDLALSVLLGMILIVSGPTVIMPILRHIRPTGQIGSILKWEGILIDPIGAFFALLIFDIIFIGKFQGFTMLAGLEILKTISIGFFIGIAGAVFIILILKRYWVPEFLHNPTALMAVVGIFSASQALQAESGLFAVIIMGIVLANQKFVSVEHIVKFKENLQILLIGGLFIVLGAQMHISDLQYINSAGFIFLGLIIFAIRPIAVYISTRKAKLEKNTRIFLASMAPRGIVAAAVASIFTLRLSEIGYGEAEKLIPITFFTIVGTVSIYGLGALPLAKSLKIADTNPQGAIIVGAHSWAIKIGEVLKNNGYRILFIDTNWDNISSARMQGFSAMYANVLSEDVLDNVDFGGIGYLLALTPNDQVNTAAALRFANILERRNVYQLAPREKAGSRRHEISPHLRGRYITENKITYTKLDELFSKDTNVKTITLTKSFGYKRFLHQYDLKPVPFFIIDESGKLNIISEDTNLKPKAGQKIISVVPNKQIADDK